jgi:hypothetical protein
MRARLVLSLLLLTGVTSCSASKDAARPRSKWVAVRADAVPLAQARRHCEQYALKKTANVPGHSLGAQAAGGAFVQCMQEQGWELRAASE